VNNLSYQCSVAAGNGGEGMEIEYEPPLQNPAYTNECLCCRWLFSVALPACFK